MGTVNSKIYRLLVVFFIVLVFMGFTGDGEKRSASSPAKTAGEYYIFKLRNLRMPMDNKGILADYDDGTGAGARFDSIGILFSGGFYLSGLENGMLWLNGMNSAGRVEDYYPGPVGSSRADWRNRVFVVLATDGPFASSWQDWKIAVEWGADFYDGDGDGIYNPMDLNNDGVWNANEDRPDLLGDITTYCVYNDAVPSGLRRFSNITPKGIEIRQTAFVFRSQGAAEDNIFVRYRIINKGTVADGFDSVYFTSAMDHDLGNYSDDLLGCDTMLGLSYAYNNGPDAQAGVNAPAVYNMIIQGPAAYIPGETFIDANNNGFFDFGETPLTLATYKRGGMLGIDSMPGARNLSMTSFNPEFQSQGHEQLTHFDYREFQKGNFLSRRGSTPCTWTFGSGQLFPNECGSWNPVFMYAGNPVNSTGWYDLTPLDQRSMANIGPFTLEKNKPVDIIVVIGAARDSLTSLGSIDQAKSNLRELSELVENNFPVYKTPPPPVLSGLSENGKIRLMWETTQFMTYREKSKILGWDVRPQGYRLYAFKTNSKYENIYGVVNKKLIKTFAVINPVQSLLTRKSNGALVESWEFNAGDYVLDTIIHADPMQGRIGITITDDPFTGGALLKGKEYFFAAFPITINHSGIYNIATGTYGIPGQYIDTSGLAMTELDAPMLSILHENDLVQNVSSIIEAKPTGTNKSINIRVLPVELDKLTGDDYQVSFVPDTSAQFYKARYTLKNSKTGSILINNSDSYRGDTTDFSGTITEGFLLRVKDIIPGVSSPAEQPYIPASNIWYKDITPANGELGAYYAGSDIEASAGLLQLIPRKSTITKANTLKRVEIRFGVAGKAYRYLNGFSGNNTLQRRASYIYAGALLPKDTLSTAGGSAGLFRQGFVDVPFQAWVLDSVLGTEKQLAVGFVEKSSLLPGGTPDGIWYPGTDVHLSKESIIIFNADYDPTGSQVQYTGGIFGSDTVNADLRGYIYPAAIPVSENQKRVAASGLFDALYVLNLSALSQGAAPKPGDKFIIPVNTYPYMEGDTYVFSTRAGGKVTQNEREGLWDKINVFPNPLFAYSPAERRKSNGNSINSYITFTNMPEVVEIRIYSVAGRLVKILTEEDKWEGAASSFLHWNLLNEDNLRVASGMYLAIVRSPGLPEKILKFGLVIARP